MDTTTQMPEPPTQRERDAANIVRTAADWLGSRGWSRLPSRRWLRPPAEDEFTMYEAAKVEKGIQ